MSTERAARHVLIVEDDRLTALVLSEYLTAHGYRTTVATSGPEGVAKFLAERPDLALVDILLPRKNGFDTCGEIKRNSAGKYTPVVLMSAYFRSNEQLRLHSPDLEADGFLFKPFDLDVLVDQIHILLREP